MDNPPPTSAVWEVQILAYAQIALFAFFLCEYIHLLPSEIKDIWFSRWNGRLCIINLIYIICRYTPFINFALTVYELSVSLIDGRHCRSLGLFASWICLIELECAQFAFFLRVYALWQDNRVVKLSLTILTSCLLGAGFLLQALNAHSPAARGDSFIPSCASISPGDNSVRSALWGMVAMVIFDSILMLMAIIAKFKFNYQFNSNSLAKKVYQDTIYYFILNFFIGIAAILISEKSPGPLRQLSGGLGPVATPCLACRVLLRLKQYKETGTTTVEVTDNPMRFGQNPRFRSDETFVDSSLR
ncbi:hypothetical protein P691DRAFT_765267 [Macrolepiota fuliginosa MF-IS2]|uniref:DUF6533 domain-containing protein n=1 Tax=Macrolepiota fuliginosa MF-IS2 TaxID=1400762 RepID=A0A9P5X2V1_9AGAR|nr:hypothetical protein P691DRAFT_765267 [Macrolepiota fuliginosa MF-IS2]